MRKKITKLIGVLFILCAVLAMPGKKAFAVISTPEQMGETFTGQLDSAGDEKWYQLKTTKDGYFEIEFGVNADSTEGINWGWNMEVYDASYNCIKCYKGITSNIISERLTMGKNSTFYILICANYNNESYAPVGVSYSLLAKETKKANWETEKNGSKSTADKIKANVKTYGTIWVRDDQDMYKYTVGKNGYMYFEFNVEEEDTRGVRWGWFMNVYDQNMNLLESRDSITVGSRSKYYSFKKGTVLYVKIGSHYSDDSYAPTDALYSIKPVEKASSAWEIEKNNTKKSATTLTSSKIGTIYVGDDVDYYAYKAKKTGKKKIKFTIEEDDTFNSGYGWHITIMDSSGKAVKTFDYVKQDLSTSIKVKKGKTYYVKIAAQYDRDGGILDYRYKIRVQ